MSDKQPEALRLADLMDRICVPRLEEQRDAAAELRRLHGVEVLASVVKAGHEQMFAECQRLHALCEEQKRLLEQVQDRLEYERDEKSVEICDAITNHLRQHEGEKHEQQ